jgi:hypothetical protein
MPQLTNSLASHAYLERVTLPFVLPTSFYGAMLVIWHLRQPLQLRFPLHRGQARDYVRFLAWCTTDGRKEYVTLRSIPEWDAELNQPVALPVLKGDRWRDGFSVAMFLYGVAHYHYTFRAILEDIGARDAVATAFWRGERLARYAPEPACWNRDFLKRQFGSLDGLVDAVRLGRHDAGKTNGQLVDKLHLADFSLDTCDNSDPLGKIVSIDDPPPVVKAHLPHGLKRSSVRMPLPLRPTESVREWLNSIPSEFQLATITRLVPVAQRPVPRLERPFGVNLFGYARGELGIGEDVRLVASALHSQGIPFCIVNVDPGKEVPQKDHSVDHWIVDQPRYAINLLCLTGVEQARIACEKGLEMFSGFYNIGLSPWELPQWPSSCQHTYAMVNELWGISAHTTHAFKNAPIPVHAMTLPVTVGPVENLGRKDFGLPEKPYLFIFAFDINSGFYRKNPEGVIRAFQKAFPKEGADEVGLVIKINTLDEDYGNLTILERLVSYSPQRHTWHTARRLAEEDPRIHLIGRSMPRPQVMALFRACDCFVSLHRAEGFGRCLSEALLLDRQLIATGYSGNMDFCAEPRVGLVRYDMRPLRPGEYFWSQGQMWAEPDLNHAAELMRDIRQNPRDTGGPHFDFSPASAGRRYAARLRKLQKELDLKEEECLAIESAV